MRTVYIAGDGTEFNNKIECESYEQREKLKDNSIIMLDRNNNLLENKEENFEKCFAIRIKNERDLDIVYYMGEYTGCSYPYEIGDFYYNTDNDEWESLDEEIEELKRNLENFKIMKEKLNG